MIIIRDRECGNFIETVRSIEEGLETIRKYEEQDKKEGIYTEDFYELVETEEPEAKNETGEKKMTVYIYSEYDENKRDPEKIVEVYADKETALNRWKERVGQYFEDPFDPESEDLVLDYFAEMVYEKGNGIAKHLWEDSYWTVEPVELL